VENAVKHGLEPNVEGGALTISARLQASQLVLEVEDTGRGIRATAAGAPSGLGLVNLRVRLAALYGDDARVTIEDSAPHGTRVMISLPLAVLAAVLVGGNGEMVPA
ncbi:MAG: ATP-binding protein, partial [Betaproteobacteria bacterium]